MHLYYVARTLFLTKEDREGVRFLMRHTSCNPKTII
jgi:hypothetical protein